MVSDPKFLHVVDANEEVASDAIREWNQICEGRKIEIVRAWNDNDPNSVGYSDLLDNAQSMLKMRKNKILAPKRHR